MVRERRNTYIFGTISLSILERIGPDAQIEGPYLGNRIDSAVISDNY